MKYSVFTVGLPEMTPEEALKNIKDCGYNGVEWRVINKPDDKAILNEKPSYWGNNLCTIDSATLVEQAPALKAMCDQYQIEVNALGTYLTCTDDPEKIESAMQAATILGCPRIRVNSLKYDGSKSYQDVFEEAVAGFRVVEKLARQYKVKANFEMHFGNITPSASAALRLASHFDSRYIGVIYDTGNVIFEGFENYKMALEILGEYLDYVHIKNGKWNLVNEENGIKSFKPGWATFKGGFADFPEFFQALKAVGYDGYISFEDFSDAASSQEKLRNNLEYIKSIAASV